MKGEEHVCATVMNKAIFDLRPGFYRLLFFYNTSVLSTVTSAVEQTTSWLLKYRVQKAAAVLTITVVSAKTTTISEELIISWANSFLLEGLCSL